MQTITKEKIMKLAEKFDAGYNKFKEGGYESWLFTGISLVGLELYRNNNNNILLQENHTISKKGNKLIIKKKERPKNN